MFVNNSESYGLRKLKIVEPIFLNFFFLNG